MSRATPNQADGFSGLLLPSFGPRAMGTDGENTAFVTYLNQLTEAMASLHDDKSGSRPAYLPAGGLWANTDTTGTRTVYQFDGTRDVRLWSIDVTGKLYHFGIDDAGQTVKGLVRLASADEAKAGAAGDCAVSPATMKAAFDARLATEDQAVEGTLTTSAVTPAGLKAALKAQPAQDPFMIGEFRDLHMQEPPPGWRVRDGAVIADAQTVVPRLWAHLQEADNAWKVKTQADWTALSNKAGGVGGVAFYMLDVAERTIRLPDTRGDFIRGSHYSGMVVGEWYDSDNKAHTHAYTELRQVSGKGPASPNFSLFIYKFVANTPTSSSGINESRPRSFALLPCVYVGQ